MFCPQFAPLIGGAERQAEQLGRVLRSLGLDVVVWTPRLVAGSPACEDRDGLPVHRFPLSDLSKVFPGLRGIGVINAPWIALQIGFRLWRQIGQADVVHCHIGSLQTIAAACVARLRGVPVICKAAMADSCSDLGEAAKGGLAGRLVAWLGRFVFTRWVATTQAVKDALIRAGVAPGRIVVIPNGVVLPQEGAVARQRAVRRFLYLGRLSSNSQRDVPGLLEAFDSLAEDMPDAELAVVGEGDLLADTRARASACRHASRIRIIGPGNASEWLEWADCFVLPSRREGLSNALLEAMAAGLPCIANDIPPNREVLADGVAGALVPVGDVGSMHAAMSRMALDREYADFLASAAVARVCSRYGLGTVAEEYERLYRTLASRHEQLA